jgi:AraC family transcriptional regulator
MTLEYASSWHRITMLSKGNREARAPAEPVFSSRHSAWRSLRLEKHHLDAPNERTGVIEGYQLCFNLTGPVAMAWKSGGRQIERTLNAADICTSTHGELRSVSWRDSYDLALLSISPRLMSELSGEHGNGRLVELESRHGLRDAHIASICTLLIRDVAAGTPVGPLYGEQLGAALAVYLARQFAVETMPARMLRSKLPGPILSRVCELIEARLNAPIGLSDLAREAKLSRFYFAKLFRNTTGQSPCQYVTERRLERARELLGDLGKPFHEVAAATGFSSHSHLASVFRRNTGLTLAQFRSLHTN